MILAPLPSLLLPSIHPHLTQAVIQPRGKELFVQKVSKPPGQVGLSPLQGTSPPLSPYTCRTCARIQTEKWGTPIQMIV